MNPYSPEYNKKNNEFEQGINRIRNKNNNFFENIGKVNTIFDMKDIKSYYVIEPGEDDTMVIRFRKNNSLPPAIETDIQNLFNQVWLAK